MKLDWRQSIVYAAIMGVEGCALYVLLTLLNKQVASGRLSLFQFFLLYPLVFALNKVLQWLQWPRIAVYSINLLAWVVATLLMVKTQFYGDLGFTDPAWLVALPQAIANLLYAFQPQLLVLIASAIAWWLGWHLAHIRIGFAASLGEFQFGLAIMLIVFFIGIELDVQIENSIAIALLFFVFALLGMSVAHAIEGGSWLSGLREGHWPGLLLMSIGLILVLGMAISMIVTPDFLQLITSAVAWVWHQIERLLLYIASLFPPPEPMEPLPGSNMTGGGPQGEGFSFNIPEPILSGLRLGWEILFGGLLLVALWRISSNIFAWLRRRLAPSDAEVEPMRGAFAADILGFFKWILFKLFRLRLPMRRQAKPEPREIASIRQIYRQLLQWAAGYGWRKPAFATPYEYLTTLEKLLPERSDEFRIITQRYVSARYGQAAPSPEELLSLKQSWHQVSQYRLAQPEKGRT